MKEHLLVDDFSVVGVVFNNGFDLAIMPSGKIDKNGLKLYHYMVNDKQDKCEVGCQVLVETPKNGIQICTVVSLHEKDALDINRDYKYMIQKVDRTVYNSLNERKQNIGKVIHQTEAAQARKKIKDSMREVLGDDAFLKLESDIGALSIETDK